MVYHSPSPSVPVSTDPLHEKLFKAFDQHIANNPNSVALINAQDNTIRLTFKELKEKAFSVAQFLSDRGFGHKQVLCQVLPNCLEYPIVLLGTLKAGGTFSGASAMFTDYELERQFLDSRCTAVATDEAHLPKVLLATTRCPLIKTIICLRDSTKPLPAGVFDFEHVARTRFRNIPDYPYSPDDVALLPYSSGTTGSPKGVMLSHKNFGTMVDVLQSHLDRYMSPYLSEPRSMFTWQGQPIMLMLPFYHIYGMGVMTMGLLRGARGIVLNKFDPPVFLQNLERFHVKILYLVPPILLFLAKHPMAQKYDLSSIRVCVSGAAPAGKDICQEFRKKIPQCRIVQAYGMTECGMASHCCDFRDENDFTSVGILLSNFEQKIIDVATGLPVAHGKSGEICVRSVTCMVGYLNRPEATAESLDEDGWLHTGDIGYLDEKGRLMIVDRLKELIKVKGLQVPPAELEDLLLSHSKIADAAIIGIKDERSGEVPLAFVVKADKSLEAEEVQKFVQGKVSSYKWLAGGVRFVSEIPKAPSGKILRRFLREQIAKETQSKI